MAAMASKFNFECVIQYYTDQLPPSAMFLASNCTCAVYFTSAAHVQLLAKNMAATHVHAICTRHLHT